MHPLAPSELTRAPGPCCLDCGERLLAGQKYCACCGQKTSVARLTLHEIAHELLHALLHADRSAYALLRSLLIRPGIVAREYVLGRRRRHFGPFATLVILIGLATLLSDAAGFESISSTAPLNALQDFVNRHVNVVVLAEVPLLALLCTALFRADRFTFAEHTVLVAYAFSLRALVFMGLILPYWVVFHPDAALIGYAVAGAWSLYFGLAASQFYSGARLLSFFKGVLAAALLFPAQSLIINALAAGYDRLKLL